jgi:hypothetical protein
MSISTVVVTNINVFRPCLEHSIDDNCKCTQIIAKDWQWLIVLSLLHVYLDCDSQHHLMPCMRMETCMKMGVE